MGNERGAWKLLVGKPEGKRPVGRPRIRWENNINHDVSQWPKWLRRQYGKLEICGSSPGYDTNFSLKKIIKNSIFI